MALRDGAYLLPAGTDNAHRLRELADECIREGGSAWLMNVEGQSAEDTAAYRELFNRSLDYADLRKSWKEASKSITSMSALELTRLQRRLQREFDATRAIDFFPAESRLEADTAWGEFNKRLQALLSPGEPHETDGAIPLLDVSDYQGRTWATRRHLWVDRVASAWLIRRFIDHDARFRWLADPLECPKTALGFDFDGAAFTHVGNRVTFETLMASFGLEDDPALARIGVIVHSLDLGGDSVPEASGFEAMLAGARERLPDDDALLSEISGLLDSLYMHFQRGKPAGETT